MEALASEVFSRTSLSHAISGAAGGTLAMLIVHPLDQLRLSAQLAAWGKGTTPSGWSAGTMAQQCAAAVFSGGVCRASNMFLCFREHLGV